MPEESLLIERRGKVLYLTLNRPERHNALDFELLERLTAALRNVMEAGTGHSSPDADVRHTPLPGVSSQDVLTPGEQGGHGKSRPLPDVVAPGNGDDGRGAGADRDVAEPSVATQSSPTSSGVEYCVRTEASATSIPPHPRTGEGAGGEGHPAVVILRGAGEWAFSAGFDVNLLTGTEADLDADDAVGVAASAIQICPVPVIACIRGYCFGAGFDLAMACDLRVASDDSQFGLPAVRLGVVYRYDLIADLISMCGLGRTRDLLFAMPTLTAAEAQSWGLLTDVVPRADLPTRVDALAASLATAPESAVRGTKETIRLLATDSAEGEELEELRLAAATVPERQRALAALRERLGIE